MTRDWGAQAITLVAMVDITPRPATLHPVPRQLNYPDQTWTCCKYRQCCLDLLRTLGGHGPDTYTRPRRKPPCCGYGQQPSIAQLVGVAKPNVYGQSLAECPVLVVQWYKHGQRLAKMMHCVSHQVTRPGRPLFPTPCSMT